MLFEIIGLSSDRFDSEVYNGLTLKLRRMQRGAKSLRIRRWKKHDFDGTL